MKKLIVLAFIIFAIIMACTSCTKSLAKLGFYPGNQARGHYFHPMAVQADSTKIVGL